MYYTFHIDLNYDIHIIVHADDMKFDSCNYRYNFYIGDDIVFSLEGGYKIDICFYCKSFGGHISYDGKFIVDFENGTDSDFDTHSVDVQNGEGYYNSLGKYVSYHKYD